MNKRQAKRLALCIQGKSMIEGEVPVCMTDNCTEEEILQLEHVWRQIGFELIRRSGLDAEQSTDEIMDTGGEE